MITGRVIGDVTATIRHPFFEGKKLLVVARTGADGAETGDYVIAIDAIGVGLLATRSSSSTREPVRARSSARRLPPSGRSSSASSISDSVPGVQSCIIDGMARPPRLDAAGTVMHIIARGNERRPLFRDDADRERYSIPPSPKPVESTTPAFSPTA